MKKLGALIVVQTILLVVIVFPIFAKDTHYNVAKTYAFTNVNVISMDKERVLRNRTIIVQNGIMTKVGKGKIPKGVIEIDGTWKYLTPGFIDMHTLLYSDHEFPDSLADDANIANTMKIAGVMVEGSWMQKDESDEILDEIAPKFQNAFDKQDVAKVEQFGKDIFAGEVFRGSFAPDGKTFYFFKKIKPETEEYRIFSSNLVEGKWTEPKVVNLGGDYSNMYPAISKDGRRMVFASYRPAPNDKYEKPNSHIWFVEKKKDDTWGEPVFLKNVNKLGHYHSWVEFGWNGNLYFRQTTPDWRGNKTLVSRWNGKTFEEAKVFEEADRWKNWKKEVRIVGGSPGPNCESIFLDVATQDAKTKKWASDIWVSLKKNGTWQEPKPLGENINKDGFDVFPFFSPDGKTMYFIRDFKTFHQIPLKAVIDSIKSNN